MDSDLIKEELIAIIVKLEAKIKQLEEELAYYKNPKNSTNSHLPPSKDDNRPLKNQSLREPSERRPGGQPGHPGTTLEFSNQVDRVVEHQPNFCKCCSKDLSDVMGVLVDQRQIIDIPPIKPERIEHRVYRKTCSCGHVNESEFPFHIKSKVQYGSRVEAFIAYLHTRQYLPFNRMKELFSDMMNLPISEGGIHHLLQRFTQKSFPIYQQIKERIENAAVLGTDETGAKVNGKKHWFWAWQNDQLTFIVHSDNRGFKTITDTFKNGLRKAVLVHDRWASHFQCIANYHQLCTAHLLRELIYIEELYQSDWANQLKILLYKALELKKELNQSDYFNENIQRQTLKQNLFELLQSNIPQHHKKAKTLQKKLIKYQSYILYFLYHPKVPPDNNGSERAIRNIKVKQKISGQFKSAKGADCFAIIRSVVDTTKKSKQNILNALVLIAHEVTE